MTTKEILIKAKEVINEPSKWTKKASAKDKDDNDVAPEDPSAVCFCLLGALDRANVTEPTNWVYRKARLLLSQVAYPLEPKDEYHYLSNWNDDPARTHEEVMEALDKAIELCGIES